MFVLEGHIKQILALDFSPNGFHVVTGSDDHTARVRTLPWCALPCVASERCPGMLGRRECVAGGFNGVQLVRRSYHHYMARWESHTPSGACVPACCLWNHVVSYAFQNARGPPAAHAFLTGPSHHANLQVWDLRARKCLYTIPGHRSLVSSCRYDRCSGGAYIVTGGYDCLVKVCAGMRRLCCNMSWRIGKRLLEPDVLGKFA